MSPLLNQRSEPTPGALLATALAALRADPTPHDAASAFDHGRAEVFAHFADPDYCIPEVLDLACALGNLLRTRRKQGTVTFDVEDVARLIGGGHRARVVLLLMGLWPRPGADGLTVWSNRPEGESLTCARPFNLDGYGFDGYVLTHAY